MYDGPERRVVRPRDRDHGRRAGDVGAHLRRPHQGGLLAQQGDVGYSGWTMERPTIERRHPHPRRRHQVAGLPAGERLPVEPRASTTTALGRAELLHLRQTGGGPPRLAARRSPRRAAPLAPPRRQPALRRARGRRAAARARGRRRSPRRTSSTPASSRPSARTRSDSRATTGTGPWLFGTEYFLHEASAPQGTATPSSTAARCVVAWIITGETRRYNTRGGFFGSSRRRRPCSRAGRGAWEAVLRLSYIDLDDGGIQGGKFWRITPMMNWHLSDHARSSSPTATASSIASTSRARTHFFQSRLQLQF